MHDFDLHHLAVGYVDDILVQPIHAVSGQLQRTVDQHTFGVIPPPDIMSVPTFGPIANDHRGDAGRRAEIHQQPTCSGLVDVLHAKPVIVFGIGCLALDDLGLGQIRQQCPDLLPVGTITARLLDLPEALAATQRSNRVPTCPTDLQPVQLIDLALQLREQA